MYYEFNKEVKLLLQNESNQKVRMMYMSDSWPMPKIGPRPPYYTNPRYVRNYPVI